MSAQFPKGGKISPFLPDGSINPALGGGDAEAETVLDAAFGLLEGQPDATADVHDAELTEIRAEGVSQATTWDKLRALGKRALDMPSNYVTLWTPEMQGPQSHGWFRQN